MTGHRCWVCKDTGRVLDILTKDRMVPCHACQRGAAVRAADREALAAVRADRRHDEESAQAEAREDYLRGGA